MLPAVFFMLHLPCMNKTRKTLVLILGCAVLVIVAFVVVRQMQSRTMVLPADEQSDISDTTTVQPAQDACGLTISSPLPASTVGHTIVVQGTLSMNPDAQCRWTVFEGQAGTIDMRNPSTGEQIAPVVPFTLPLDWMETALAGGTMEFAIPLSIPLSYNGPLSLVFVEDDPSGERLVTKTLLLNVIVQ